MGGKERQRREGGRERKAVRGKERRKNKALEG